MVAKSLAYFSLLALCCAPRVACALDLFVAPDGSDNASGTAPAKVEGHATGPFATLERARDEIRRLRLATQLTESVTVHVRAGVYELPRTFTLDARDSGTVDAPVVYRAYQHEKAVLLGGKTVSGFEPYKGMILKTDVARQGLKDVYFRQLFFDDKRQPLARYPNYDPAHPVSGGWAYVDGDPLPIYKDIPGENKHTLVYKACDARDWSHPEEGEVFVFPRFNWWNNIVPIKSIDQGIRTITLAGEASYPIRPHDRYFVQNLFEELDSPGEWYLDRRTWTLYFWPPEPLSGKPVRVPALRTIIAMNPGAAHVTVRGFTIECSAGTAIVLKQTNRCLIAGNVIRNCGDLHGSAVSVEGGTENGVAGNDISRIGRSGVCLGGGDRKTLTPSGNYADNNYIHHFGIDYKEGVGVELDGVGNRASHNLIHDGPRFAILFGGNNQIIEYNHIRHVALETEDVGAIYCGGRDWISPRGTVIRYNFIHDVIGFARVTEGKSTKWVSPYFSWGIYLDDNSGGVDVIGNIVARCGRALLHGHSARDCLVENNIFVEGGVQQWEFNGWTTEMDFWHEHFPTMRKGYESVANEPAWQGMRGMKLRPEDAPDAEGRVMCGNVFTRNIMAWSKPGAHALEVKAFNGERNTFDRNLYWHSGMPILTGCLMPGKAVSGNLVPNPDFNEGDPGSMPPNWNWQIHPRPDAIGAVAMDGDRRCLRMDADFVPEKQGDNHPIIVSRELELKRGATYRLRAKMRTDQVSANASLMVQSWIPPQGGQKAHFWGSYPNEVKLTGNWKEYEFTFTTPMPGKDGWHEKMKMFCVRFDWPARSGSLFAGNVVIEEVESLDEWRSWQALGGDRNSIIGDPMFLNPGMDDYRLAADSPAWKLGFKPIPVEKIGPYEDPLRASWPIIEEPGARER
jgi:hypothetical protein